MRTDYRQMDCRLTWGRTTDRWTVGWREDGLQTDGLPTNVRTDYRQMDCQLRWGREDGLQTDGLPAKVRTWGRTTDRWTASWREDRLQTDGLPADVRTDYRQMDCRLTWGRTTDRWTVSWHTSFTFTCQRDSPATEVVNLQYKPRFDTKGRQCYSEASDRSVFMCVCESVCVCLTDWEWKMLCWTTFLELL